MTWPIMALYNFLFFVVFRNFFALPPLSILKFVYAGSFRSFILPFNLAYEWVSQFIFSESSFFVTCPRNSIFFSDYKYTCSFRFCFLKTSSYYTSSVHFIRIKYLETNTTVALALFPVSCIHCHSYYRTIQHYFLYLKNSLVFFGFFSGDDLQIIIG